MKLYRKGSEVILFTASGMNGLNGIYKVIKRVSPGEKYDCPHCGKFISLQEGYPVGTYGYYLELPCSTSCCLPFSPEILKPSPKLAP